MKIVPGLLLPLLAVSILFCGEMAPNAVVVTPEAELPVLQSVSDAHSPEPANEARQVVPESSPPAIPSVKLATQNEPTLSPPPTPAVVERPPVKAPDPEVPALKPEQPPSLHAAWSRELAKYVDASGAVNYKEWVQHRSGLDQYLAKLSRTDPTSLSRAESIAFWINAYNAFTVQLVLDHYPVKSIRDLHNGKPWDVRWINISGRSYSLNDIEHEVLFGQFPDPQYHFALVCAAASCPPLLNIAWEASTLDKTLDARTRSFIRDTRFNRYEANEAAVSQLFEWYGHHFGDVRSYLNKYLATPLPSDVNIRFLEYDWSLNVR